MLKKILTFCLLLLILTISQPALASQLGDSLNKTIEEAGGSQSADLTLIIANIVQGALGILGLVFIILIIYGGVRYMLSQGETTKIEKSKGTIKAAIIGLIIIVCAYSIAYFVTRSLETASLGK